MSERTEALLWIVGIVAFLAAFFGGGLMLADAKCKTRWQDYENRWSLLGGCQVNLNGKWTPENRIREFNA